MLSSPTYRAEQEGNGHDPQGLLIIISAHIYLLNPSMLYDSWKGSHFTLRVCVVDIRVPAAFQPVTTKTQLGATGHTAPSII
jgi:hypothetical protein